MNDLLRWEWMIFFAPLGIAVLMAATAVIGAGGDHDVNADSDIHADSDVSSDLDGDGISDPSVETLSGTEFHGHETHSSSHDGFLTFFGVGRAPLSIVGLCLLLLFSVTGLVGNLLLGPDRIVVSLAAALAVALLGTRYVAIGLGKLLPSTRSHHVERHELIGVEGVALYPITDHSGTVRLYDRLKTQRQLDCRLAANVATPIPENTRVVVTNYDSERQLFLVARPEDVL